jgi:hypothetical protein
MTEAVSADIAQREMSDRPVAHYAHQEDPSGRTALCGGEILGVAAFGNFTLCRDCAATWADDYVHHFVKRPAALRF